MKHFFPKTFLLIWLIPAAFALHPNCGGEGSLQGGAKAGNPPVATRTLTGSVPKTQTSLVTRADVMIPTFSCVADEVVAVDSAGEATTENMDTDCSFSIELIVGEAYSFSFNFEGDFVATMAFSHSSDALTSSVLVISEGETAIDVGTIEISGSKAYPESEPATQNDQDGDGVNDFDDEDDDDDGIPDLLEDDCDLDGIDDDSDNDTSICEKLEGLDVTDADDNGVPDALQTDCDNDGTWDVYDADTSGCHKEEEEEEEEDSDVGGTTGSTDTGGTTGSTGTTGTTGGTTGGDSTEGTGTTGTTGGTTDTDQTAIRILEVSPQTGSYHVDLDEEVEARVGCTIDLSTVTSRTFIVIDRAENHIECDYELSGSGDRVECEHDKDRFEAGITYYAYINGITCSDGTMIDHWGWYWTTRSER